MELAGIEMRVKMVEKRTRENEKKWKVSKVMQKGVEAFFRHLVICFSFAITNSV